MIAAPAPHVSQPAPSRSLSWSAISTYRTCPLKYYFRYVARLPEETVSASLVFGAAIHRALEHHFRQLLCGEGPPSCDDLLDHYQAEWQQRDAGQVRYSGSESQQSQLVTARRLLMHFQDTDVSRPSGKVLAVEEELLGPAVAGAPDLRGKVDLIVETSSELLISDWKTSRARWSECQIEDAAEQLLLYAELAGDFAPGKPVCVELVVLTKTKTPVIDRHRLPVDATRLRRTRRLAASVWRAVQTEHFYPAPSATACGGCPFREPCRRWPD